MPKHYGSNLGKMAVVLCLILTLAAGGVTQSIASSLDSVEVVSAPLVQKASAANGMVRVFLSSLGNPSTLNLTITGNYSVNGNTAQSITSGSSVTVGFSSSTGAITLTNNGIKTNMGTYFALRRHSASGTNGIKIAQARESKNLYPGDISFRAVKEGGSYKLYTVAHIYIENYLYGVLPYEMGNSTNIEALKAQAVAARTYTVRLMQSRASGYFDVYDTTSDQVYRGTPSGNANCVAAVDATKGIVLMYGSTYITTYYSASNGGQTDTVRKGTSYPYLVVKNDPFDFANPSSTVKSKTVYADLSSSSNNAALMNLLKSKAVGKLSASNGATTANTTLKTLKSVTPHTPMYNAPSRLYTKMDFTMTVSVGGAVKTVTVTCDIFNELESMLSMGIQSSQNELWSIKKSGSNYVLQARRYGHGWGMSQRGAMQMAKLGYNYDEILGFYYDGCKRVQHSFTNTILNVMGESQTTIEDPAELTGGGAACKGTVKLVSANASLAIRKSKSTTAELIGTAGNGAIVQVLANDGTWCFIQYGSLKGYVPTNALDISGTPTGAEETPTSVAGFATVTASDFVNMRASGDMSASVVSTAPNGAVLTVFSQSGAWAHVQYCATVAYVNTNYISSVTSAYPSGVVSSGSQTATVATEGGTGTVELRATASTSAAVLAQLAHGAEVTVSADDGSWCTVVYNDITGYILSEYIAYSGDNLGGNPSGGGEAGNPGGGEGGGSQGGGEGSGGATGINATVSAEIGYLRELPNPEAASKQLIAKGTSVVVNERGDVWCAVTYGGDTGYMLTASLRFADTGTAVTKAVVTTASGSLNMRAEAKAGSRILTTIPRGIEILVTSVGGTWSGVQYGGYTGYVMSSFLTFTQGGGSSSPSVGETTATVTTQSGSLNLRAQARSGSKILRTIPQYATISVHQRGAEWCDVTFQGTTGYVMTVFLTFADENASDGTGGTAGGESGAGTDAGSGSDGGGTPGGTTTGDGTTNTPSPPPDSGNVNDPNETPKPDAGDENTLYAVVNTVSGSLNLRRDALPGSDVLARIPKGATIVISQKLAAWSQTTYGGQTGYVMNAYLTFASDGAGSAAGGAPGQADNNGNGLQNGQTAVVVTESGSLNLRATASSDAERLTTIPRNAIVTVQSAGADWCQVTYMQQSGYVMTRFLRFEARAEKGETTTETGKSDAVTSEGEQKKDSVTAWIVSPAGAVELRQSASDEGAILASVPLCAAVELLEQGEIWSRVKYNNQEGYMQSSFLSKTDPIVQTPSNSTDTSDPGKTNEGEQANGSGASQGGGDTAEEKPQENPQTSQLVTEGGVTLDVTLKIPQNPSYAFIEPREGEQSLTLWKQCVESGEQVAQIPNGDEVEVVLIGETWCQVQYQDKQGYCLTKYLSIKAE